MGKALATYVLLSAVAVGGPASQRVATEEQNYAARAASCANAPAHIVQAIRERYSYERSENLYTIPESYPVQQISVLPTGRCFAENIARAPLSRLERGTKLVVFHAVGVIDSRAHDSEVFPLYLLAELDGSDKSFRSYYLIRLPKQHPPIVGGGPLREV